MSIGTIVESKRAEGVAIASRRPRSHARYLCDGGCRPNPGTSLPVIFDGTKFHSVSSRPASGNHSAVYDAVDEALDDALERRVTDVAIELVAKLVYHQLAGTGGCSELLERRNSALEKAGRFASITWVLVTAPLQIGVTTVPSRRALRHQAARSLGASAGSPCRKPTGASAAVRTSSPAPTHPGP